MIYLDHNATTPVAKAVLEAMLPFFSERFGNASSVTHPAGTLAAKAVEKARAQVATLIHADPSEIIFTSGATEAINLALKGTWWQYGKLKNHFIVSKTEHPAVLETVGWLATQGAEISWLGVNSDGRISLAELRESIRPNTLLASIMHANNETGVIQPVEEAGRILHESKVLFFCDATQSAGKIPVDVNTLQASLLCLSAHKMYGPKGVGALYIRRKNPRVNVVPLLHGGGQENNLRGGTINVPLVVGLGEAAQLAYELPGNEDIKHHRDQLRDALKNDNRVHFNTPATGSLPNTLNFSIENVPSQKIIAELPHLAFSSGSACASGSNKPSHVLQAMGLSNERIKETIRISLGRNQSNDEVEKIVESFLKLLQKL